VRNALTVDVEDYFQVTAFEGVVDRKDWAVYPSRVENNTRRVMALLDEHDLKGTFFVLGWVAERFPLMVREMADNGHEVACHGFGHELVYNMTPESFRADVHQAKTILENITGRQVLGYRAPSYSIVERSMWALDVLIEEGFVYDSSIFPIHNGNNGALGVKGCPHEIRCESGTILELPLTTLNVSLPGRNLALPIAGGGYLRLLPAGVIHWGIRRINQVDGQPAVLYFRPWEIDPEQPRIKARLESRFRHYVNLELTEGKLRFLFKGLEFGTVAEVLGIQRTTEVSPAPESKDHDERLF
jgi:polysaccharide deacetylase family protein (PEP-CTERM system associated)